MRFSSRPLFANELDSQLFTGRRAELEKVAAAVRHGFNTLVVGPTGSGRTSLLYHLSASLAEDHVVAVVPLAEVLDPTEAIARVADGMLESLSLRGGSARELVKAFEPAPSIRTRATAAPPLDALQELSDIASGAGPYTMVAMLDDAEPSLVHTLFGQHRDAVWRLPLCWIVVGDSASTPDYLRPPADAFFEELVELGSLSQADAIELLRRRLEGTPVQDAVLAGIATGQGADTPRGLIARARRVLLETTEPTRLVAGYARRDRAISALGRSASMLAKELESLGPVSASDERLLRRLGWTRPRVVQILRQLEAYGLVVSRDEHRGKGRPIKLYALKEPDQ